METVLRIAFVYVFLLIGLRVLGKRELSELSPFELVTLMIIPEITQPAMTQEDFSMTNAVIGLCTVFCLVYINAILNHRFKGFRRVLEGEPVVLVAHGRLLHENMDRERVPADEILSEMHKHGIELLADVRWAILETDGKISVIGHAPGEVQHATERIDPS